MKKGKPFVFILLLVILMVVGASVYRNVYLKGLTQENLGDLCGAVKDGKIRDYHNTIGVSDKSDIFYVHDDLLKVYKIYYGNYTIYLADEDESGWSPAALEEYLDMIGITFKNVDGQLIFFYFGDELSTKY